MDVETVEALGLDGGTILNGTSDRSDSEVATDLTEAVSDAALGVCSFKVPILLPSVLMCDSGLTKDKSNFGTIGLDLSDVVVSNESDRSVNVLPGRTRTGGTEDTPNSVDPDTNEALDPDESDLYNGCTFDTVELASEVILDTDDDESGGRFWITSFAIAAMSSSGALEGNRVSGVAGGVADSILCIPRIEFAPD